MRAAALAAICATLLPAGAAAYEFEILARTVGQAYQLRSPRTDLQDVVLLRRRFEQTLALDIWSILEPRYDARRPHEPPLQPFDVFVSFQGRVLHDFGDTTQSTFPAAGATVNDPVTAVVPELANGDLALEVLWAQVGARGILDRIDLAVGRQLVVSELDWFTFDGLAVAARLPAHIAVEGQAGMLVRGGTLLGADAQEPDGTSLAQCRAYDGSDLGKPVACTQRDEPAPTFGLAVGTHGLRWLSARLSYRRSVSATADGLYFDEGDVLPAYGVVEEKLAATARGKLLGGALVPWGAARWNVLLGLIDEADLGVRVTLGDHALAAEALYSFPSFEGDSIFNVFSTEPFWDARLTYDLWPGHGKLRGYARGFWRHFEPAAEAGGATVGARLRLAEGFVRAEARYEDGYGGLRAGGDLSGRWKVGKRLAFDGRLSLIRFEDDLRPDVRATSFAAQAGAVLVLGPRMAVQLLAEENVNRIDSSLRLFAIVDLAFRPEH